MMVQRNTSLSAARFSSYPNLAWVVNLLNEILKQHHWGPESNQLGDKLRGKPSSSDSATDIPLLISNGQHATPTPLARVWLVEVTSGPDDVCDAPASHKTTVEDTNTARIPLIRKCYTQILLHSIPEFLENDPLWLSGCWINETKLLIWFIIAVQYFFTK